MRLFVTGATGFIGSAVVDDLIAHGHDVVGLARSDSSAAALHAAGATVRRGSLDDSGGLAAAAGDADGVVHLAFGHDFSDYAASGRREHAAVRAMLDALDDDRPFLFASALVSDVGDRPVTEDDPSPFHGPESLRGGSENLALPYAGRGVRPVALRFPIVHGVGDPGFLATLARVAADRGVSGYVGDGTTRWPGAHRTDTARAVRLALEEAPAGSRIHPLAEEGVPTRDIAAAIGEHLGLPTASIAPQDAEAHFGWIAGFYGWDIAGSSTRTRELLGWEPTGPRMLDDIAAGAYPVPV